MEKAELKIQGKLYPLPVVAGSAGKKAVDISHLYADAGYISYDPGLSNTAAFKSAITFIDGEKGVLRYRGISTEQLVQHSSFLETAYLLLRDKLPATMELGQFSDLISQNYPLEEDLQRQMELFPPHSHPVAVLSAMINALLVYQGEVSADGFIKHPESAAAYLMGKISVITARIYKRTCHETFITPDPQKSYISNLLHMMFSTNGQPFRVSAAVERVMNRLLILHADNAQNCSTTAVRMAATCGAGLLTSILAGLAVLSGPRHGGANQIVMNMLENIRDGKMNVQKYLDLAKDKKNSFRLMGFGNRTYKNRDPRAVILKQDCHDFLPELGSKDPLLDIARQLEEKALADPYFTDRNLYPNVDFYSGILLRAIGIPREMFPLFFALGRLPGWMAHWLEVIESGVDPVVNPCQVYIGASQRSYVPIEQRNPS